jgi:tripartite-type tricarboxylate transporter receptor subunit TctC
MNRLSRVLVLAPALLLACGAALAQYPSKPIRFIVGFPPGGSADPTTRILGAALSTQLGQPLVVENRPGADSAIAAEALTRMPADGYTIMFASNSAMTAAVALRKAPAYDPLTDFTPISMVGRATVFLYAHPSVPGATLKEFIAHARANPGKLAYGTGNPLSILYNVQLMSSTGIDMLHVPYKGGAPMMIDLVGGQVNVMFVSAPQAIPQVKAGRIKALAIGSPKRIAQLPDTPTVGETLPGFAAQSWVGMLVPAGTPQAVVARLHDATGKALADPAVRGKLSAQGFDVVGSTPEAFLAFARAESDKWAKVIARFGVRVE